MAWDKLAADLSLEECTSIIIDNLIEILTFCLETTFFRMGSDMYYCQYRLMYTGNTQRNHIKIYILKAISLCQLEL